VALVLDLALQRILLANTRSNKVCITGCTKVALMSTISVTMGSCVWKPPYTTLPMYGLGVKDDRKEEDLHP
jgi:hypothetical protein